MKLAKVVIFNILINLLFINSILAYEVSEEELDYWIKEITDSPTTKINSGLWETKEAQSNNCYVRVFEFPLEEIKKLADDGSVKAQYLLGLWFYSFDGRRSDYDLAAKYFQKASENGNKKAKFYLSQMVVRDLTSINLFTDSSKYIKECADKGSIKALTTLADSCFYYKDNDPQKEKEAMDYYLKAAEKNDSGAMLSLYILYKTSKNIAEAGKWLKKAVANNYLTAMRVAFYKYTDNQDLLNDPQERENAFELGKKLCASRQIIPALLFFKKGFVDKNEDLLHKAFELSEIFDKTDKNNTKFLKHQLALSILKVSEDFENALLLHKQETERQSGLTKDIMNLIDLQLEKDFKNLPLAISKIMKNIDEKQISQLDYSVFDLLLSSINNYYVYLCEAPYTLFDYRVITSNYKKSALYLPFLKKKDHRKIKNELLDKGSLIRASLNNLDRFEVKRVKLQPVFKPKKEILDKLIEIRNSDYNCLKYWYKNTYPFVFARKEWENKLSKCLKNIQSKKIIPESKIKDFIKVYKDFVAISDELAQYYMGALVSDNSECLLVYLEDKIYNFAQIDKRKKVFYDYDGLRNEIVEIAKLVADFKFSFYDEVNSKIQSKFDDILSILKKILTDEEYSNMIEKSKNIKEIILSD